MTATWIHKYSFSELKKSRHYEYNYDQADKTLAVSGSLHSMDVNFGLVRRIPFYSLHVTTIIKLIA